MSNVRFNVICFILFVMSVLTLSAALVMHWETKESYEQPAIVKRSPFLPKPLFAPSNQEKESYSPFQLQFTLPELRVPNLSALIAFHGKNKRPDVPAGKQELFFSLAPSKDVFKLNAGEKVYLKKVDGGYALSDGNSPTSLWIVPSILGGQAKLQVRVENSEGVVSAMPQSAAELQLPEKPLVGQQTAWNVGNWRADSALLLRQKARWYGKDLFIETHGGDLFRAEQGKQRVSFGVGDEQYFLYVEPGDYFVFDGGSWQAVKPGMRTEGLPLIKVVKVDDKVAGFELYSPNGAQQLLLNLIRTPEQIDPQIVLNNFQFIGARTRVHSQFTVSGKRELVGPGDWFVLLPEGWSKLKKIKEIDQYVEGSLIGPLLVIGELQQQGVQKSLKASLYSPGRSVVQELEIPLIAHAEKKEQKEEVKKEQKELKEQSTPSEDQKSSEPEG